MEQIEVDTLISKDANEIFKEYAVSEVETISQKVEVKSAQIHLNLQNLVKLKYRDLLKTSDLIIEMNELSKKQDNELYELSFLKNGRINKLFNIERNFNKFEKMDHVDDILNKQNSIIKTNESFIKLSNFLNINENNSINNLNIIESIEKNLNLPINFQNFNSLEKSLIIKKFNNLINLTILNISNNFKIFEILKVYKFWSLLQRTNPELNLNFQLIDDEIFKNLIKLINYEFKDEFQFNYDNINLILKDFGNFREQLLNYYVDKINEIESHLTELEKNNANNTDKKLNLYELDFNDENYLNNVKNLNNGLVLVNYQNFNANLLKFIKNLNVLNKLNIGKYNDKKSILITYINNFKQLAINEKNKLLIKYLEKLIFEINK